MPLLEEAGGRLALGTDDRLVIAKYGSSQGKNSMIPMQAEIATEIWIRPSNTPCPSNRRYGFGVALALM